MPDSPAPFPALTHPLHPDRATPDNTAYPSPPYRIQPIVSAQRLARRSSLLRNASATAAHAHAATATGRVFALQRARGSAM